MRLLRRVGCAHGVPGFPDLTSTASDNGGVRNRAARESVRALLRTRRTLLADVDFRPDAPERVLVRSDLRGSMQLYLIDLDDAAARTVNGFDRLYALTSDPRFGHQFAGISPDGRTLAYVSDRSGGVDFDLWLCDLERGEHRLLHAGGAWYQGASGFSPDGLFVSVLRPGPRPLDVDLVLVDVTSGATRIPLPHPGEAAVVEAPAWISDSVFYASSNVGREFAAIVRHDLDTSETTTVPGTGERFDAEVVPAGTAVVVIENREGANAMWRYDPQTGERGGDLPLPEPGVSHAWFLEPPIASAGGSRLYYTLSTPRLAGDVYSHDLGGAETRRLTHSPAELAPTALVAPELGEVASFDGERIPLFVFRPRSAEARLPVVVEVHGGPEAQAMRLFDPQIQALVVAGYAVVVPNVRGSTGYGKRYAALDDTTKRLDSVRDLQSVHGALEPLGFDPGRAVLWGGSYGGYMTLAGLAFAPELWAAGVDIVGISNLVTFLENTSAYRRAHREREYGSLTDDRDFLIEASPLTHLDAIRAPLFVIHGRNDPRVPLEPQGDPRPVQHGGAGDQVLGHIARLQLRPGALTPVVDDVAVPGAGPPADHEPGRGRILDRPDFDSLGAQLALDEPSRRIVAEAADPRGGHSQPLDPDGHVGLRAAHPEGHGLAVVDMAHAHLGDQPHGLAQGDQPGAAHHPPRASSTAASAARARSRRRSSEPPSRASPMSGPPRPTAAAPAAR
jgi:dipeptidyl aminopeptidase/acylaminoacyl peptidase